MAFIFLILTIFVSVTTVDCGGCVFSNSPLELLNYNDTYDVTNYIYGHSANKEYVNGDSFGRCYTKCDFYVFLTDFSKYLSTKSKLGNSPSIELVRKLHSRILALAGNHGSVCIKWTYKRGPLPRRHNYFTYTPSTAQVGTTLLLADKRYLRRCGDHATITAHPGELSGCPDLQLIECRGYLEIYDTAEIFGGISFLDRDNITRPVVPVFVDGGPVTVDHYIDGTCVAGVYPDGVKKVLEPINLWSPSITYYSNYQSLQTHAKELSIYSRGGLSSCNWDGNRCATLVGNVTKFSDTRNISSKMYVIKQHGDCFHFWDGYLCKGCRTVGTNNYCIEERFRDEVPDLTYEILIPVISIFAILGAIGFVYLVIKQRRLSLAILLFMERVNNAESIILSPGEQYDFKGKILDIVNSRQVFRLEHEQTLYQATSSEMRAFWQVAHHGYAFEETWDRCPSVYEGRESPPGAYKGKGLETNSVGADFCNTAFTQQWACLLGTFDVFSKTCYQCNGALTGLCGDVAGGSVKKILADADSQTFLAGSRIIKLIYRRVGCSGSCPVPRTDSAIASCSLKDQCNNRRWDGDYDKTQTTGYNLIIKMIYTYNKILLSTVKDSLVTTTFRYDGKQITFDDEVYYNTTSKLRLRPQLQNAYLFIERETLHRVDVPPVMCEDYFIRSYHNGPDGIHGDTYFDGYCETLTVDSGTDRTPWSGSIVVRKQGNRISYFGDEYEPSYRESSKDLFAAITLDVDADVGIVNDPLSSCNNLNATADCGSTCYYTISSDSPGYIRVQGRLEMLACHGNSCETHFSSQHHYLTLAIQCQKGYYVPVIFTTRNYTLSSTDKYATSGVEGDLPEPIGSNSHDDLWGAISHAFSSVGNFIDSLTKPLFLMPIIFILLAVVGVVVFLSMRKGKNKTSDMSIDSISDYDWIVLRFKDIDVCVGIQCNDNGVCRSTIVKLQEGKNFNDLRTEGTSELRPGDGRLLRTYSLDCLSTYRGDVSFDGIFKVQQGDQQVIEKVMSAYSLEQKMSFPLSNFSV